jgi:hypothetical protein
MNPQEDYLKTTNAWKHRSLLQTLVAFATMSAFLFLVAAPRAHADERDKCRQRVEKAEGRLNAAVAKHGANSPEARDRWHELRTEREHCWTAYHQWWDGRDHRWRTDPDWDHDDRWPDEHH